jgi:hypothetical protein
LFSDKAPPVLSPAEDKHGRHQPHTIFGQQDVTKIVTIACAKPHETDVESLVKLMNLAFIY